jgi:hypothetical protein
MNREQTLNLDKTSIFNINRSINKSIVTPINKDITKEVTKTLNKNVPRELNKEVTKLIIRQVPKLVTKQITKQVPKLVTKQITKNPFNKPPYGGIPKQPPTKVPPGIFGFDKKRSLPKQLKSKPRFKSISRYTPSFTANIFKITSNKIPKSYGKNKTYSFGFRPVIKNRERFKRVFKTKR